MPSSYKKENNTGIYQAYTKENLTDALNKIRAGKTVREVSEIYKISIRTLSHKLKGHHSSKNGRPTSLSEAKENCILTLLLCLAEWGFPVDATEL